MRFGGAEKPRRDRYAGAGTGVKFDKGEPGAIDQFRANTMKGSKASDGLWLSTTQTRLCTRCKQHKPKRGGSIRLGGRIFLCAECKP